MLGNHGRGLTKALFTRPALALGRLGVTPNMLTVTGTILSVTAAVTLLPRGHFVAGPLVLLVVLVADSFDGILARATGKSSVFGAFLDSTMDRLADGAVLGSLAAWAALSMPAGTLRTTTIVAALAAMILGAWRPLGSLGAALLFGFATSVAQTLPVIGSSVSPDIISMIPYIVTILAVPRPRWGSLSAPTVSSWRSAPLSS